MFILRLLCVFLTLVIVSESQIQEGILAVNTAGLCLCAGLDGFTRQNLPLYRNSVHFTLYTRENNNGESIRLGNTRSLRRSSFNPQKPLKVITHGWWEQNKATWMIKMKDALLSRDDVNVILTDWSPLAIGQSYAIAANSAQYVGRILAEFLNYIETNNRDFSPSQVHLIGFSMGAHVSGIAGRFYRGIDRITGLDPAGPVFECLPSSSERLTPDDANFVDVIHTNDGCDAIGVTGIGHKTAAGHQDFYVNGGGIQPGCPAFELDLGTSIANLDILEGKPYVCHHHRATDYFTESILSPRAYGFACRNYRTFQSGTCLGNRRAVLGYDANREVRGNFYLTTMGKPNFLVRYIGINVDGIDRNILGRLSLIFTAPNGDQIQTIILRDGLGLVNTDSGTLALPVSLDMNEVDVSLRYEPLTIISLGSNDFLDRVSVTGVEVTSSNRYCLSDRESTSSTVRRLKLSTC